MEPTAKTPLTDPCEALAALRYPPRSFDEVLASLTSGGSGADEEIALEIIDQDERDRTAYAENLRLSFSETGYDPVMSEIEATRRRRDREDAHLRYLLAYAGQFATSKYLQSDLARLSGMSQSGVSTAATDAHVEYVQQHTGLPRRQPTKKPRSPRDRAGQ
ncbi:hypothetical protein SMD44_p10153 (plasmid) [Streptomyces alboflavus]|uniref:Uncharacterized protein n=1 Tax=Streptomyces alboflavus TaxID=67267 RepID=A0A291W528_9ACTN|nr:hypothetical protein [Streptomyces alboflavus]ATM24652.1 hypothetical protein SMD44_p10153 [Streptomyces alboflavus]